MTGRGLLTGFRFRFGQRVRVKSPHPESGITGHVLSGRKYADGHETYSLDVPGALPYYESDVLEEAHRPRVN